MKFLKIFYLTIFVIGVSIIINLIIFNSNEKILQSTNLQTINTSAITNVNQFRDFKSFQNPDFTVAAEKTINCVVHVKNTTSTRTSNSLWELFYGNSEPKRTIGTGSGVIVSSDGYIITNYHVIDNANSIEVTTNENKSFSADLIGFDENSDIAILKIDNNQNFPYIIFADSDQTKIGEWVLAVGNPFNLTSTVTAGIISAKSRDLSDFDSKNQSFIQTDAAVNSGNSGGALVNINGELIGINTAIQSNNAGFIGYSFAVPSNIAKKIFEDILEFGDVQRGLLGVTGQSLNSENAKELGISKTEGFYVNETDPDMGAYLAGMRKGDIILQIDDVQINKFSDLSGYLNSKRPGDNLNVTIDRMGKKVFLDVLLKVSTYIQFYGMQLKDSNKDVLDDLNIDNGVTVVVNRNSTLYRMGVRSGYILTEINGKLISSTSQLKSFEKESIYQISFVDLDGNKERLIFD